MKISLPNSNQIKYWNASGSGFPPSLIPALQNIGISHYKKAKLRKHLQQSVNHSNDHFRVSNSQWVNINSERAFLFSYTCIFIIFIKNRPGYDKLKKNNGKMQASKKNPPNVHSVFTPLGGIQQLRGPILTQFWPPPPLEWTSMDILHTPSLSTWTKGTKKAPPPHKTFNWC